MISCCRNCIHLESGGHCAYWKSSLKEISGFDSDTLFSCTKYKEKKNMKCPLEILDEFSEWSNTCQECQHYQECMNKCYDLDKPKKNLPLGDNYPVFEDIHHKLDLNRNRTKMVIKLLNEDTPKITKDDITDIGIDIELYNKQCRKEKIKRQYKQRTGKDDNV